MIMIILMIHADNYAIDTFGKGDACENTGKL